MELPSLFYIFILTFCIDCTSARPPPCNKESRNVVKNMLDELGYDVAPKTISEWREAFGRLAEKHENAKLIKAKLTPRMLIDDIEGDFANEYQMAASQFPEIVTTLEKNVKKTDGEIKNLRNILNGRPLSAEERQKKTVDLMKKEEYLKNISQQAADYAYYRSPLPDDAREERIERRIRKWHWKYHYGIRDRNMIKLQDRVKIEYKKYEASEDFKTYPRSLAEFTMDLFVAIAEGHDTGSGVVHVDGKISAEEEFPKIDFLGDDYLDLHLTMFINTLGRKKPFDSKMFDRRRTVPKYPTVILPKESTSTTQDDCFRILPRRRWTVFI